MGLIGNSALRRAAGCLAGAALVAAVGMGSALADVTYSSYNWIGDVVTITGPNNFSETGGAGQIQLNLSTGGTLLAWCLDVADWLQPSGNYSVTPNGPINGVSDPSNGQFIGGLMLEGNKLIAAGGVSFNNETWSKDDVSAAAQIAIWSAEYGSTYQYSTSTNLTGLITYLDQHAGSAAYVTLDPDLPNCTNGPANGCTYPTNQHLGYAVPGPLVGTGLPGLLAACAGLIAFARRRRLAMA